MILYWVLYTDNTIAIYQAESKEEAEWRIAMEGDHVVDSGFCPI